jgi:CubicO group peptidase (beta-lactamase class C family)
VTGYIARICKTHLSRLGWLAVVVITVTGALYGPAGYGQSPGPSSAAQPASTQDISGSWQGILHANRDLRIVVQISKGNDGGLTAVMSSLDEGAQGGGPTTLRGSTITFTSNGGTYEGKLSPDGGSIEGIWTMHDKPLPLNLARATKETAWAAPDQNWGHTPVKVDPKVFDGYAGRYRLNDNFTISMMRDGDHLYTQGQGQQRFELLPTSDKEYFARVPRVEVIFHTNAQGEATEFVLHQGGREMTAKKIVEATAADLSSKTAAIDAMVAAEFAKHPLGSVTVGVVSGKELIWTKSYGNADMEKKVPADKDTVYRIGSITKMFTAVMLEQLVDAGKVHLSDPVEKYFPEVKTVQNQFSYAPPITLIQLATHTSGMDREPGDTETYLHGPVADWEKTLIAALAHTHYEFEPGTRFFYSNIGFATLGAALSRASGQSYLEYVPQHIFQPLGMTHTALEWNADIKAHLSKGYQVGGGKVDAESAQREHEGGRGYKIPNGAIYTTVGDLARFTSFLLGKGPDSVLKSATLERNLSTLAVQANFNLSSGYMLGGMVMRRDGYTAFGHGGAVAGYQAGLYMNRQLGVGVIVLANAIGGDAVGADGLALRSLDLLSK